ncbi:MAG TPA: ATP-binding cassette domain-containing protein [Burkholderiales bacterium]|nr:ATP-binding cassette domain-containing protein [Burkholderiales bacterium]
MPEEAMIEVEHLVKAFGPKLAVNDVSFTVERGEVLGFLGPNGAGKSTTMRMVTGFIPPTSGRITVGGYDMLENPIPAKRLIGYLPENAPGYADMTVVGFLNFAAELRGLQGEAKKKAVRRAVELCFLESVLHQSIDTLSKGYKHRTCLAQALIHDPDILVMDEPTDGLDPNQKHEVRNLIKAMGASKAIIFSTHILEEVEAACTRVIIIDRGRIVANGTPEELKARAANAGAVRMRVKNIAPAALTQALARVPGAGRAEVLAERDGLVEVRVYPARPGADGALTRDVAELAARERWQLDELHTEEGRLDEVFRSITLPDTVRAQ